MPATIDQDKCMQCQACVDACPAEAIVDKDGNLVIDETFCLDCGACVGECATEAIEMD